MKQVSCKIYRGGTSKGIVLDESLLPPPGRERDAVLLALIGGPDAKQVDGLGGAVTTTSKVAIIRPSNRPGIDVDYTFAQVVVGKDKVDYRANCGNMSSTVGPFAIEQGWVHPQKESTVVRIFNTNTEKVIVAHIPTDGKSVVYEGDYQISGVQRTGSRITLEFIQPQGAATGRLLPTGNPVDTLAIPELGEIRASIIDAANLFVFVSAEDVGLKGNETIAQMQECIGLQERIELIRGMAAQKLGYVTDYHKAKEESISVPKLMIVAPAAAYTTTNGKTIAADELDIQARMISAMKPHPTMAMTGAMCLVVASVTPGTLINALCPWDAAQRERCIRLGHPGGVMEAGVTASPNVASESGVSIEAAIGYRTARLLMQGIAYYSES